MIQKQRLDSIDLVRGAIMILMALDHTRDYFGMPANPTDLRTASVALFFTRWLTHFCAPVFFLLMGTAAFLAGQRRGKSELSRFLFTRGAWLILLEVFVLRCFAYQFNFDFRVTMLLVLWALGWGLIVLAPAVRLPVWAVAAIGAIVVAGHNLFDGVQSTHPLWQMLHSPGVLADVSGHVLFAGYALVPWIAVPLLGYALGTVYLWDPARRQQFLVRMGLALIAAFIVIRAFNGYGDRFPWAHQRTVVYTVLSFINTTKYPPSLQFLLMTGGPALLLLAWAEARPAHWPRLLLAYGRVPLFYFMLHFFLIHALAAIVCTVKYGSPHWMFESPDLGNYPFTAPPGWGFSLPVVYLVWVSVVVVSYPLCRWFAGVKARNRSPLLSYL